MAIPDLNKGNFVVCNDGRRGYVTEIEVDRYNNSIWVWVSNDDGNEFEISFCAITHIMRKRVFVATLNVSLRAGLSKEVRENYRKFEYRLWFVADDMEHAKKKWWDIAKSHRLKISFGFMNTACTVYDIVTGRKWDVKLKEHRKS